MLKLLKNKKGNDVHLLWTIIVILFSLGLIVPYIDNYFTNSSIDYNIEDVGEGVAVGLPDSPADVENVGALDLVTSILSMFFWSFSVNIWINILLLEPMRIIFYILIYRLIRSGGG